MTDFARGYKFVITSLREQTRCLSIEDKLEILERLYTEELEEKADDLQMVKE